MGRKKAPVETAANGGQTEGDKPADKAQAVRLALGTGLTSPTELAAYVANKYGMEVTTNYVSVIKSQLKHGSQKPAAPKAASPAKTTSQAAPHSSPARNAALGSLTPDDLAELADLVDKVGGVDRLEQYLEVIKRMK